MRNDDYSKPIYSTSEIHCAVTDFYKSQSGLISREESKRINKALNIFRIWLKGQRTYVSREDAEYAYRTAIEYLNKYKPIVEQTGWISVKDSRKPKIRERVWVTDCDGQVWIMYYNDCDCYFNEFGDVFADDIIAWQPIIEPSPYKEEEHDT